MERICDGVKNGFGYAGLFNASQYGEDDYLLPVDQNMNNEMPISQCLPILLEAIHRANAGNCAKLLSIEDGVDTVCKSIHLTELRELGSSTEVPRYCTCY